VNKTLRITGANDRQVVGSVATWRKELETSSPDWPYFLNFQELPRSGVPSLNKLALDLAKAEEAADREAGRVPASGRKFRVAWPPTIKRKMTDLAFGRSGAGGSEWIRSAAG
jgi:hypothetical protein